MSPFFFSTETALPKDAVLTLFDAAGQQQMQTTLLAGVNKQSLLISKLSNGMYYWSLQIAGAQYGKGKLVVMK